MQCSKVRAAITLSLAALLWGSISGVSAQEGGTPETAPFNQTYERTLAKAQDECKTLSSSHTFHWLRQKIPLGDEKPTLSMLTSKERLHPKDKPRADLAIKTNEQCRQAYAPLYAMLPARDMISGLERRQDAVIAELYVGKITFGEFNVKWSKLRGEHMSALSGIPQTTPSPASSSVSVKTAAPTPGPLSVAPPAQSAKTVPVGSQPTRIALVIGNSNYVNLPKLSNPANDARSIHDTLQQMGFITKLVLDASEQDLRREVRKLANDSNKASIALVFYAGHGAQINGDNYVLPVDMEIAHTEADIQLMGLKVDDLVNSIRSNTKIVFLDACRDNPALYKNLVHGRSARVVGLAPTAASNYQVNPGGGIFIAYATEAGSVAEDGSGKHSPFTQALLRNLQKPISIDDMFSFVIKEVRQLTKSTQRPYKYASLENIVCLTGNCGGTLHSREPIDPVEQAQRSESEDLQIALQTNNPDALESFSEKYPDSPKRTEVLETISSLRRSEFHEWTLFEMAGKQFPWFMQISSIQQLGSKVAVRHKITADPSIPLVPGKDFPDAAYADALAVFDCELPRMAMAENTVISKSGEVLYHYKWADPRYFNLSIGAAVNPSTVGAAERTIVCHDEIRTPLLAKKRVATMNFASLSSTATGDGDIFYAPINDEKGRDDVRDVLLIFKMQKDTSFVFPGIDTTVLPTYRIEVDHVKLRCFGESRAIVRSNFFDASYNLIYLTGADPSAELQWKEFPQNTFYTTLQRIMCPNNFVGLGIQVVKDGMSVKVVKVIDETPAQTSGMKVNDIITHLDDQPVDELTLDQVVAKMRGDANTKIKLRIAREGQQIPIEVSVARGVVKAPAVQWPPVQSRSVQWPPVQSPSAQWPSVQGQVQQ